MIQSDELLRALPVPVIATDRDGNVIHFNDAAAALWRDAKESSSLRWPGAARLFWPDGSPIADEDYPLARLLRGELEPGEREVVVELPDGSRTSFVSTPRLVTDASGSVAGAVDMLVATTDRSRHALNANRLAAIVANSDDAIVGKSLDGIVTSWNAGAERIFGYTAEEMIGQPIIKIIPPDRQAEELDILASLKRGEHVDHYDTKRVAKDGRTIDVSITVSPIRDGTGTIVGASKIARDVSERKRAEETQRLIMGELNHRVKNTLGMVQSMAAQSVRRAETSEQFVASFAGRVQALARAHNLLVEQTMQGAELEDLLIEQVLLGSPDSRVTLSGPSVQLDSKVTVHLGLVLHELATNARKYGALSRDDGRLRIEWKVESVPKPQLFLEWRETAPVGPAASIKPGFGTSLIERTLLADGGEAALRYESGGISCSLRVPLGEVVLHHTKGKSASSRKRGAEYRIIVIEDEPLIAMDIENELIAAGFTVLGPCATVEAALAMIEQHPADAAVLDANLHGQPVNAVAAALTQRSIPFVFATGYGRDSLPRGFGTAPILPKPFGGGALISAVEGLLRKQGTGDVVELHPRSGNKSA